MSTTPRPTEGELEILNILWLHGPSTVRAVHEHLAKDSGYTTTLKLMQIMHDKGLLNRDTSTKMHIYKAAVDQEATQGHLVQRMIDNVFNGSAMSLVMQALGNHTVSKDELKLIEDYLANASKNQASR